MAMQRDIQVETGPTGKAAVITETVTVVRRLSPQEAQATMDQLAEAIAQKEAELADLKDRQDKLAAVADSLAEPAEPVADPTPVEDIHPPGQAGESGVGT